MLLTPRNTASWAVNLPAVKESRSRKEQSGNLIDGGGKQPKHLSLHVNWSTWPRAGERRGERAVEGRESKAFGYDKTDSL
jgi:hypothetical protein